MKSMHMSGRPCVGRFMLKPLAPHASAKLATDRESAVRAPQSPQGGSAEGVIRRVSQPGEYASLFRTTSSDMATFGALSRLGPPSFSIAGILPAHPAKPVHPASQARPNPAASPAHRPPILAAA